MQEIKRVKILLSGNDIALCDKQVHRKVTKSCKKKIVVPRNCNYVCITNYDSDFHETKINLGTPPQTQDVN